MIAKMKGSKRQTRLPFWPNRFSVFVAEDEREQKEGKKEGLAAIWKEKRGVSRREKKVEVGRERRRFRREKMGIGVC